MSYEEAYQDTFGQLTDATPEPVPVQISFNTCPYHGFHYINTPRDAGDRNPEVFKCPLRGCHS